jgi:FO synthase subunit 1
VQVPPNLSPTRALLDCGVDDLGGVSPVTDDYINPDYAWPALRELVALADDAGVPLRERLPVHDRYLPAGLRRGDRPRPVSDADRWLGAPVRRALAADGVHAARYRAVARGDAPLDPVADAAAAPADD